MRFLSNPKFLALYSGVVTCTFGLTVLCGFAPDAKKAAFEQIDVQRINIVDPDGKIRMVISNRPKFPGSYVKGVEYPRGDRGAAGMIFMNDEGTEMGGLVFGGSKSKEGDIEQFGHLSFDQYMQDQVFAISAGEGSGKRLAAMRVSDRADYPITESFELEEKLRNLPRDQRDAEWKRFFATHTGNHERIEFGRAPDKSVVLKMKDTKGRDRLIVQVAADGSPTITFLDEHGKATSRLPQ